MKLAPVVVFAFKRIDLLSKTLEALSQNYLALDSDLIVFSDGPNKESDIKQIEYVRSYLSTITGFKSIKIINSSSNKGLANSIIGGVSEVLRDYDRVIVLEDDLVTSRNFLNYMNEALNYYENNTKVFSIAGFSIPIVNESEVDVYFTQRSNSTGWATWKDRWEKIDWEVSDYINFKKNKSRRKKFNKMGSDMCHMLDKQMKGRLNSWAIRWCYHQFKYDLFSVHPYKSKIVNIGFDSVEATNTTEKYNRFDTKLDKDLKVQFNFPDYVVLDRKVIKQFVRPFTILARIKFKIFNLLLELIR